MNEREMWFQTFDGMYNPMANILNVMKRMVCNIKLPHEERAKIVKELSNADESIRKAIQMASDATYEMLSKED